MLGALNHQPEDRKNRKKRGGAERKPDSKTASDTVREPGCAVTCSFRFQSHLVLKPQSSVEGVSIIVIVSVECLQNLMALSGCGSFTIAHRPSSKMLNGNVQFFWPNLRKALLFPQRSRCSVGTPEDA